MNITDNARPSVEFRNVSEGDVFKFGDNFYMKIRELDNGICIICNAIKLCSGSPVVVFYKDKVIPVNHELVIK